MLRESASCDVTGLGCAPAVKIAIAPVIVKEGSGCKQSQGARTDSMALLPRKKRRAMLTVMGAAVLGLGAGIVPLDVAAVEWDMKLEVGVCLRKHQRVSEGWHQRVVGQLLPERSVNWGGL